MIIPGLKKINKGFSLDDFNNAVSLIQKLNNKKGYNLKSKAYIFVKPILLKKKTLLTKLLKLQDTVQTIMLTDSLSVLLQYMEEL